MTTFLKGKKILITGGTGSIGSAIAKKALLDNAKIVKIFSNDENGHYVLERELNFNKKIHFFLGDIKDEDRVRNVAKDSDIIFHAAALKHVDRCEYNPLEAVAVNIGGTRNIINAALREKVKKVILISTDKAVNPVGVMGSTKLLSEKLISAESRIPESNSIFASIRFGNVLNSRGSIVPYIEKQIKQGGPITLTDERMIRFFMTMEDAVNLSMIASQMAKGGETFVLKMPIIKLKDLFEAMKHVLAPKYGFSPTQIKTKIIGARPGEKIIEALLTDYEMEHALETNKFFIIPSHLNLKKKVRYPGIKIRKNTKAYFKNLQPLNKQQITEMVKKTF